jgi:small-conductance mechanosensitive channel/CRP-like cAMP-binding protein
MFDFFKFYGRLLIATTLFGVVLALDNLFTGPLAFVSGIPAASLKQYELAAFLFALTLLAARFSRRDIVHGMLERRSGGEVPKLIGDLTSTAILFTGICVITAFVFKKDITALLATGGAGLMILGIALRDLLLAAFTGVLLNIEKPFRAGDLIKVNDKYTGVVEQITWRTTILQTANGRLNIPNLVLANAIITNFALPDKRSKRRIEVAIDYDTSVESAERILYAAVLGAVDIKLAKTPSVFARRMERDGVIYVVSFTITNYMDDDASEHAVIKSILQCMRNAGVTVSFPKSEVIHSERRVHIADRSLDIFYLVQQCRLFSGLSDEICHRIADLLIEHHFPKGAAIVRAGESRFSLFIIGEGMTKRIQTNLDGSRLIEQRFIATEAFGRKALFSCQPQASTVVTESNALIYELSNAALTILLQETPSLLNEFSSSLAHLSWLDSHRGQADLKPDPVAIERLHNIFRGQIEACYGIDAITQEIPKREFEVN